MTGAAQPLALADEVAATARRMSALGLSPNRSGNVSARTDDGFLITPSALAYDTMSGDDIVHVGLDGAVVAGAHEPSSETPFHLAIYQAFQDAGAIVHCHSPKATALAAARLAIPAWHYMVAVAGGTHIPLADYATFGSDELAENIVSALRQARACLIANHGQVAYGKNLAGALELASEVETLASGYITVRLLKREHILDDGEMTRVLERFEGYGKG